MSHKCKTQKTMINQDQKHGLNIEVVSISILNGNTENSPEKSGCDNEVFFVLRLSPCMVLLFFLNIKQSDLCERLPIFKMIRFTDIHRNQRLRKFNTISI